MRKRAPSRSPDFSEQPSRPQTFAGSRRLFWILGLLLAGTAGGIALIGFKKTEDTASMVPRTRTDRQSVPLARTDTPEPKPTEDRTKPGEPARSLPQKETTLPRESERKPQTKREARLVLPVAADILALIGKLKVEDVNTRLEAIKELETAGKAGRAAVPELIGLVKKADPFGAEHAALLRTIERLGVEKAHLPMLVVDLKSKDSTAALAAVRLLGILGEPCLATVIELLEDEAQPVRHRAAAVVLHFRDVPAAKVIPALVKRLKDEDCNVRFQAGMTLASLKGNIEPALPALLESLGARNMGAANALGRIGPAAREAVPALRAALGDTVTCTTILWLDSSDVSKKRVERHTMAEYAAAALGGIGAEARAAVPDLLQCLSSPLAGVRLRAAVSLGQIAPGDAKNARAVYHLLCSTQSKEEQTQLLDVLAKIDAHAVGYLVLVLRNGGTVLKVEAIAHLSRFGSGAKHATGALTSALKNNDAGVRTSAARALGEIGPGAKTPLSISHLRVQAMRDQHTEARQAAQEALTKIEK